MSLTQWERNGWLRRHTSSKNEIANLFKIVERDLDDTDGGISADWRFGIAYNASLKLCTILLYAKGFRVERSLSEQQFYEFIAKLWAMLIWGNKKYVADKLITDNTFGKLKFWDYTEVLQVHEALEAVNESINRLGLVPQSF